MTPQPDKIPVGIQFTIDQIVCPSHAQPMQRDWEAAYPKFQKKLLQYIEVDADLAREAGGRHDAIPLVLNLKPFCCRLSFAEMLKFYVESVDPYMVRCIACHQAAAGGLYTVFNIGAAPKARRISATPVGLPGLPHGTTNGYTIHHRPIRHRRNNRPVAVVGVYGIVGHPHAIGLHSTGLATAR